MATWSKPSSNAATWTKQAIDLTNSFLLLENGGYILQEDGASKLILEQSIPSNITWTHVNQN